MALLTTPALLLALALGASAAAPSRAPRVPVATRAQATALVVPPLTVPAGLGPLGEEVRRALLGELARLHIEARVEARGKGEESLVGRLERGAGMSLSLRLLYHDTPIEVRGDLEHLDELVGQAVGQLRAVLAREHAAPPGPPPTPPPVDDPKKDRRDPPRRTSDTGKPDTGKPDTGKPNAGKPDTGKPDTGKPDERRPLPTPPPPAPPLPLPLPPAPEPDMAPPSHPPEERPSSRVESPVRVAVHVVGDPPQGQAPAPFYGSGYTVQQALVSFLRSRLRVVPVAIGLYGLRSGLEARREAGRVGARYSLMVRFDSLAVQQPGFGTLALSGRVRVVLLYEGSLVMERAADLQPTPFGRSESPGTVASRAAVQALSQMSDDLRARLFEEHHP